MSYPPQDPRPSTDQDSLNSDFSLSQKKTLLETLREWIPLDAARSAIRLPESASVPYTRLATDEEHGDLASSSSSSSTKIWSEKLRKWIRPLAIAITTLLLILLALILLKRTGARDPKPQLPPIPSLPPMPDNTFGFEKDSRPSWLGKPPAGGPLVLRVAVVSRVDEFDRRQAVRDSVFKGIRESDVTLDFRFFVGTSTDADVNERLAQEDGTYGDLVKLEIADKKQRLSEKRYGALKWGGSVARDQYDWFMTMDSDTFVRFGPLAQRMPIFMEGRDLDPRKDPILIGRLNAHLTYFQNTVPDEIDDPKDQDEVLKGPWFSYPSGIGYMLSSSLVEIFLSVDSPTLPHHIPYPSDDVMIGAWIAGLEAFPDTSIEFETTPEHSPLPVHKVIPRPYLPEPVHTDLLDDVDGWHDFSDRGGHNATFSWSSVCVHHVTGDEMRYFRGMEAIKGEWEDERRGLGLRSLMFGRR